jgi:hypothetical protein
MDKQLNFNSHAPFGVDDPVGHQLDVWEVEVGHYISNKKTILLYLGLYNAWRKSNH